MILIALMNGINVTEATSITPSYSAHSWSPIMRINLDRLMATFHDLAQIGPTPEGGACRLALSPEDKAGRALFIGWAEAHGGVASYDAIGNLFVTFKGQNEREIMLGSHLDTQPNGGHYDGIFGVLSALEVVRTLQDHGHELAHTVTITAWTNEEGARFSPAMMGSSVYSGLLPLADALKQADRHGVTVATELADLPTARRPDNMPYPQAYLEAHIEQGPVLEKNGMDIGVVTGGQGIMWFDLCFSGQPAHAGTTPMPLRHDPLFAFTDFAQRLEQAVLAFDARANVTIGKIHSDNSSYNTIMQSLRTTIDIRHPEVAGLKAMHQRINELLAQVCAERGVAHELTEVWYNPPQAFDATCIDIVRNAAAKLGYAHQDIISGAGHDAILLAKVCPTTMIFIPCLDGISHNPVEYASPEQIDKGTMVLLETLVQLDLKLA
ncbi:MAG: Zn-dependent hydrolase [Neisseriaceae bacterium]|nr:Zn-dependent hydrolase [Neisseriaceae bacterium]